MSTATFTELTHTYKTDGVVVPSVTQVLTLAGISDVSGVPLHILERAAAIGTAVHQATELLEQDDLDMESLDPSTVGYVRAYQLFKEVTGFKAEMVEYRTVAECSGFKYGMCVDRVGTIQGKDYVLDIKTSSRPQPSWAIQTAAYARGVGNVQSNRGAVHLAKDGTYKIIEYSNQDDYLVWIGALSVAHWKLANGTRLKG